MSSPKEEESKDQQVSQWTPVWDDNAQAYYWWNTETNETTWHNPLETKSDNPLDFLLDRIDNEVKKKLDGDQPKEQTEGQQDYNYYYDPSMYTSQAHFNARTGRFTTQADVERLNPENLSIESRATRQMQNYFDVDLYTEQRNQERMLVQSGRVPKRKPLTRKEVEYFKRMKKEKKSKRAREWLLQ
ncbi:hypothetical protein EDC96DRAFT_98235 [Choanephora cucurbitarum]|nr:hypothetical protein EDC96DRAFT_98235 [Choanephora cucurbitarum]